MVLEKRTSQVFLPTVQRRQHAWFNDAPIYYILPNHNSPDIRLSRLKSDPVFLDIQMQRVLARLQGIFGGGYNWLQGGRCLAPSLATIEQHHVPSVLPEQPPDSLKDLTRRFDSSFELPDSSPTFFTSLDVTLNTATIIRDLVASALARGVKFETGIKTQSIVMERYGPTRVKGMMCRDRNDRPMNLRAKLFIFAVGSGFEKFLSDLDLRVRLKMYKSAMVVAYPSLWSVNFARMSINTKFHFNHLIQSGALGNTPVSYSMLANSGFSPQEPLGAQEVAGVDDLLETAERYFGDELYARRLLSYDCAKTEFITDQEEKRRYSYWIESPNQGNFMCILPGKFSFFPTVAHQTHLRVKELLDLKDPTQPSRFLPEKSICDKARQLVADHYPIRMLAQDGEESEIT